MSKPFVFVSCGQYTEAEKATGATIVELVKSITNYEAFFAEDQCDLAGLDDNILSALRDCAGLICVMHPRGSVTKPDRTTSERASVWIEQEIAIATYIMRTEKRPLPSIAFIHASIAREGLRQLIHLNPIVFHNDIEIPGKLALLLSKWKGLAAGGSELLVKSQRVERKDNHQIRRGTVNFRNNSTDRISNYNLEVRVPSAVFKHFSELAWGQVSSDDPNVCLFRVDEKGRSALLPMLETEILGFRYCITCAETELERTLDAQVTCKIYAKSRAYELSTTLREVLAAAGDEIKF